MARLVYACRFEVQAVDGLDKVVAAYREWLVGYYCKRHKSVGFSFDPCRTGDANSLPASHLLSSIVYEADAGKAIRVRWSFPDNNDVGLRWSNDIRIGQFAERCSVEHLISIESVQYSVSPARLQFGSPRVVREICAKTPTYVGNMRVRATPYDLQHDALGDLLALLTSDLRKLPVVILSPYARGEPNIIDANQLARNLAGVAVIVRIEDPEVTWDFAHEVGRQLSCFNGAARIYWPGFTNNADPRVHRLFFGSWIEQVGSAVASRTIERTVFAVAAFRFVPDERISDLVRTAESVERQKLLSEKRAAGDDFWKDYERDLALLEGERERVQELEIENANLKANQQVLISSSPNSDESVGIPEDEVPSLSSVTEAVEAAARRCGNIQLLDSAYASASSSTFLRPYDVYKALADLNEIVDVWRKEREKKGSGGDLLQHLRDRGWGKRSSMRISDTTRGKYRSDYEFIYKGRKQLFEPHITIGAGDSNSCASIHFILDQNLEKMVIGHVGKHLPNTKT